MALIHLIDEPLVPSDRIEPARLLKPAMNFKDVAGMKCVISGWGVNETFIDKNGQIQFGNSPHHAMQAEVSLVKDSRCKKSIWL